MDPLTLFALANGAVSAVKAGCELYKEIKGAAGDVKDILNDLDDQFHNAFAAKGKTPSAEIKKQFLEKKARIKELNKKDHEDIYFEIGKQLGAFFDNQAKCIAVFEEEERRSYQVYTGNESVGHRALQRVLMKKKLERMEVELRELMVYQSPPELGDLYTEVLKTSKLLNARQAEALKIQIKQNYIDEQNHKQFMNKVIIWLWCLGFIFLSCIVTFIILAWVVEDRIEKYPHLGREWFPKGEQTRRDEAAPKHYVGR
jgi:hypothetical protein